MFENNSHEIDGKNILSIIWFFFLIIFFAIICVSSSINLKVFLHLFA